MLDSDWLTRAEGVGIKIRSGCINIGSRKPTQCIKTGRAGILIGTRKLTLGVKIGSACIKIRSRKPSQCIKIWRQCIKILFLVMYTDMEKSRNVLRCGIGYFRPCATIFGTVRFFLKNRFFGHFRQPARAEIYYACEQFITCADTDMTWCYVKRLYNSLEKLNRLYKSDKQLKLISNIQV